MQERRNSIADTLELRLSCTNPSLCYDSTYSIALTASERQSDFDPTRHPIPQYLTLTGKLWCVCGENQPCFKGTALYLFQINIKESNKLKNNKK